jgi:hypothetical protein
MLLAIWGDAYALLKRGPQAADYFLAFWFVPVASISYAVLKWPIAVVLPESDHPARQNCGNPISECGNSSSRSIIWRKLAFVCV